VTSDVVVFDKTYTRKYFGVQVTEKYIMNVLQSGKVIYKHTYSRKFPGDPIPFTSSSSENWEYNYGGTVLGDHQIEVRDFVCKRGDYSGMDEELKVSVHDRNKTLNHSGFDIKPFCTSRHPRLGSRAKRLQRGLGFQWQ
jgi:hypothetical protein